MSTPITYFALCQCCPTPEHCKAAGLYYPSGQPTCKTDQGMSNRLANEYCQQNWKCPVPGVPVTGSCAGQVPK